MSKLNLALLSGGNSSEREVSLLGAEQVYAALDKAKYNVIRYDPKTDIPKLVADASGIDVALIIMHGAYGEDGRIQGLLDLLNIPYQGSGVLGSAVAMNKLTSKHLYVQAGLPGARYVGLRRNAIGCINLEKELGLPLVVKPASAGSSVGVTIVRNINDLEPALQRAFEEDHLVLIEEYIKGVEITCAVIGNDAALEALPLVEIVPRPEYDFFDYEAKYKTNATDEICPARISPELTLRVQELAKAAHRVLFCEDYSRSDMIIRGNDVFLLETNTIPGITANSLLPKAAKTAGMDFPVLLDKLVELALHK